MNKELKRQLLKESENSIFAKIALIELYIEEKENIKMNIKYNKINSELLNKTFCTAKEYYMKELNNYSLWYKISKFIKSIF